MKDRTQRFSFPALAPPSFEAVSDLLSSSFLRALSAIFHHDDVMMTSACISAVIGGNGVTQSFARMRVTLELRAMCVMLRHVPFVEKHSPLFDRWSISFSISFLGWPFNLWQWPPNLTTTDHAMAQDVWAVHSAYPPPIMKQNRCSPIFNALLTK